MFQIILSKNAEKFLNKTHKSDKGLFNQFIEALDNLADNPKIGKKLVGNLKGYFSYRVRDYRIIYEIDNKKLLVFIEKIAHRKESYQ